jgi:hypothetical protein
VHTPAIHAIPHHLHHLLHPREIIYELLIFTINRGDGVGMA